MKEIKMTIIHECNKCGYKITIRKYEKEYKCSRCGESITYHEFDNFDTKEAGDEGDKD